MINIYHEDAILRTFILLVQTAQSVLKYTDTYLYRKARLSTVKFKVLQALSSNKGVMMPSKLAEWTQTERHNITTLIDRMKKEGLITTERNTRDKRVINVTLTDKGKEVLSQATPVTKLVINQVMASITESEAAQLEKSLRVLRQNADRGLQGLAKHPRPPTSGNGESTTD